MMPEADTENLEVDFSRAKDGLRRYWWLSIVFAVLLVGLGSVRAADDVVFEAELQLTDQRRRLQGQITLDTLPVMMLKFDTDEFQDRVDREAGTSLSYSMSLTDRGLMGVAATGSNATEASANLDTVLDVMNQALREEEIAVGEARVEVLDQTIADIESTVSDVRSGPDDDVAEILERGSLVGLLAEERAVVATLEGLLAVEAESLGEIRRTERPAGTTRQAATGLVGGAALGTGIAVLLGFVRRRVSDETDVRRITGTGRVLRVSDSMSDGDLVAVALGLLRLRGPGREPASLTATGARSAAAAEAIARAAAKTGLPLTLAREGEVPSDPTISLVEPDVGLDKLLTLPDDVVLVGTATVGERLDDLMTLTRRLDAAGYESAGTLLIS